MGGGGNIKSEWSGFKVSCYSFRIYRRRFMPLLTHLYQSMPPNDQNLEGTVDPYCTCEESSWRMRLFSFVATGSFMPRSIPMGDLIIKPERVMWSDELSRANAQLGKGIPVEGQGGGDNLDILLTPSILQYGVIRGHVLSQYGQWGIETMLDGPKVCSLQSAYPAPESLFEYLTGSRFLSRSIFCHRMNRKALGCVKGFHFGLGRELLICQIITLAHTACLFTRSYSKSILML